MTRHSTDLILFLLLGICIGLLMRQRENNSTPPPKGAKAQRPPMATRKQTLAADFREAVG